MRPVTELQRAAKPFEVISPYSPSGDQPTAIAELTERLRAGEKDIVLLGATGTGKTKTLQALAGDGDVDVVRTDDGESVYRRCSTGHHHHLVCRDCGRTVEVEGPAVERWADKVSAEHGFTDVSHTVEIFGLCAECSTA